MPFIMKVKVLSYKEISEEELKDYEDPPHAQFLFGRIDPEDDIILFGRKDEKGCFRSMQTAALLPFGEEAEEEGEDDLLDLYFACGGDGENAVYLNEGVSITPEGRLIKDQGVFRS